LTGAADSNGRTEHLYRWAKRKLRRLSSVGSKSPDENDKTGNLMIARLVCVAFRRLPQPNLQTDLHLTFLSDSLEGGHLQN
jgi:hypothetical protein